jgi:ABC-type transporter Mla subunit MlaD
VQHLADVRARLDQGLHAFAESLEGHKDAVEALHEALEPVVKQVEERLDPMHNAVSAVRDAAARVGLPFA